MNAVTINHLHRIVSAIHQEQMHLVMKGLEMIDLNALVSIAQALLDRKNGLVIFTGVGKSGFIAQKLAMTFVSCGIRSVFLSPVDALHGDIGIVNEEDTVIALSRSGETDEILQLVPFLKGRKALLIALTCEEKNRLSSHADLSLCAPLKKEAGPFDMIPTTSTALQLMMGDLIALSLIQTYGMTVEEFAKNHPAGRIGKRLTLTVQDLMLKGSSLPIVYKEQKVADSLIELSDKKCGCLLICTENAQLLGIFTDGDLRRALQRLGSSLLDVSIQEVMTPVPRSISQFRLAYEALEEMESDPKRLITVMPVVENEQLVGLIRMHDLLQVGL